MLNSQIHMYSVDTSHFYSNHEKYLHGINCKYRRERNFIRNKQLELESQLKTLAGNDQLAKQAKKLDTPFDTSNLSDKEQQLAESIRKYETLIVHKRKKAHESKDKLLTLLSNKVNHNIESGGSDHVRVLRENDLLDNNVISVFESCLTRTIGVPNDEFTDSIMVVQVYYFDVFKDISYYGYIYKGEKYRYFTSSAGQIRKKKAVFIKESVWNRIEKTMMCGLTIDKINEHGGINVNKYLAYMALSNSATDVWTSFDIDRCIVVDDFETLVPGTYDFIDDKDFSITRMSGNVPVPHMDGCGIILPSVMDRNTMFRMPWFKGLISPVDYIRFIKENNCPPIVKDIYGKEWNVIEDDIRIIFTKSQFKLYSHYESWQEYKDNFKKYGCQACLCNTEEDRIKNAKINYQMLQTLTNITDEEIDLLTSKSVDRILNVCRSEETMKDILGITPYNANLTPFQQAVKIYPALLNDTYAKDVIREVKNSLLQKYRSGKLEVNGKYTFILPDLYAFCEWLFQGIEQPKGLLGDGEVFCWLFKGYDKLDCLRSPHLDRAHGIKFNVANKAYGERVQKIREWFPTNGLYTSTWDLLSKLLQFDDQ